MTRGAEFGGKCWSATVSLWEGFVAFVRWWAGFFDSTNPMQSTKRLAMVMATFTLCRGTIILAKAIAHQVYQGNEVPQGTVLALAAFTVPVAALAGVVYLFRKDGTVQSTTAGADPAPEKP
jgi:hypothetical protein